MANAIHKTDLGETLAGIAEQYYAVRRPDGAIRNAELGKVTRAIRKATGPALQGFTDRDALPAGVTLAIPTMRELNRAVFADNPAIEMLLSGHGFDHARKLLRYPPDEIVSALQPLPDGTTEAQVARAWMLTAFLNLDAMDPYTARFLFDQAGISSLKELAAQSPATIDSILQTLTGPEHQRPPELATQDNARRWIVSAKIQVRKRISELTKLGDRFFQVPFEAGVATSQAEYYDNAATDVGLTSDDARMAARLARLYRFQAALIRGNVGLRSGNWSEAVAGYQDARRHWHRLAEETSAIGVADDRFGLNFNSCVETARRLLESLPAEEDSPLGAPAITLRREGTRQGYRLRGFRFNELHPEAKQQAQTALADVPAYELPRQTRDAVKQQSLRRTRGDLRHADENLISGLVPGSDTALTRDLEEQDRHVLDRNLGATRTSRFYSGDTGLGIFAAVGDSLPLSDIASHLPDDWTTSTPGKTPRTVASLLSDEAQAQYPPTFLDRTGVAAATKFVVMPGETGSADRFVPLGASFGSDYEEQLIKPRLVSNSSEDLLFDDEVWASAGAFAAAAPYLYSAQIPMGLRRAYTKSNQPELARQFGGLRMNAYNADGTVAHAAADLNPRNALAFDPDLLSCSTSYTGTASVLFPWELVNYAESTIATADYAYRQDDRDTARATYADVRCAIDKFFPGFAGETNAAMTGVQLTIESINKKTFAGIPEDRNLRTLTTLDVVIVQDDVPHRVMEGTFLPVRRASNITALSDTARNQSLSSHFDFHILVYRDPVTGNVSQSDDDAPDVDVDPGTSGHPTSDNGGPIAVYVDHDVSVDTVSSYLSGSAQLYQLYLYCVAKIQAIDAGLNWYGYPDDFVPPWSFDHLYDIGRDLCNRALDAEQRVFTLIQLYESAHEKEFLAAQTTELMGKQLDLAKAKVAQQIASNFLSATQALESQQQAAAQAKKSGVLSSVTMVVTTVGAAIGAGVGVVVSAGTAAAAIAAGAAAAAGPLFGFVGTITGHTQDVQFLDAAENVTVATLAANTSALNVAIAERDVASLQADQATEYVKFLGSQMLNSDAYLFLLGLAKSVLETYIYHANRMAWLAERALENETRQNYDLIKLDYTTQDELADLTRAQQLTAGLEMLRSEYTAGQTARLQEVRWDISLSELDPIAWRDLRESGTCTFVLRQRAVDMFFPGLYQHRLKDVQIEITGLVPPDGARGVLTSPGVSYVRVPNEQAFIAGTVEDDWITTSLAGSKTFAPYDQYVMKQIVTSPVTLTLSQFNVQSDQAVLATPQGILTPVEHLGLDSGWALKLHRQSNNFDFHNIVDATFTFWFLCTYDSDLEQAQVNALIEDGNRGLLTGVSRTAFAMNQPDAWNAFAGAPADGEALDVRYLVVDVGGLPLWEKERRLKNVLIGCARAVEQNEITLRLCCDYDPAGVLITTSGGAAYSLIGIDTSSEEPPPTPNTDLEEWLKNTFYLQLPDINLPDLPGPSGTPRLIAAKDPEVRWVIKATPTQAGEEWQSRDENGALTTTSNGPLQGFGDGTGRYLGGDDWTDISATVKVAHGGGTVRLAVRDDGFNYYALQISPSTVTLLKVEGGLETQLADARSLVWLDDEFLLAELRVTGNRVSASIDNMTVFDGLEGNPSAGSLQSGSVGLRVISSGAKPVLLDDMHVVRLTGLGLEAETLLNEPFTAQLPAEWTFANGASNWSIAAEGIPLLDLSQLFNVVLSLDYTYQMNVSTTDVDTVKSVRADTRVTERRRSRAVRGSNL
jgi:hypothetical protein